MVQFSKLISNDIGFLSARLREQIISIGKQILVIKFNLLHLVIDGFFQNIRQGEG